MERNRLICVRIPLEVLEQLDKMSSTTSYLNRSRIINSILEAVVKCCPGDEVWKIIHCYDPYGDGLQVSVTKKEKL